MRNYWTAIRPINLAIVFASQIIIYLAFFQPISTSGLILFLWPYKIYAFSFVTMGITAGGYLINDYFDFETDQINKKRKHGLKRIELLGAYYTIFFIGLGMSFWLAYEFGNLLYALIYLAAQGLLFCYASSLKSTILIGNVMVSLFTAGALWIFFIAEQQALDEFKVIHPGEYEVVRSNLLYIGFFIFLLNLIREIVKDIEDVYGDKASGLKTLVIAKGVRFSSAIVRLLSVVLLVILAYWGSVILDFQTLNIFNIYFVCGLFLPVAFISYLSIRLVKLKNIRFLQQYLKAVMISGLIFIALFAWI